MQFICVVTVSYLLGFLMTKSPEFRMKYKISKKNFFLLFSCMEKMLIIQFHSMEKMPIINFHSIEKMLIMLIFLVLVYEIV